jgi:hypothetical protein
MRNSLLRLRRTTLARETWQVSIYKEGIIEIDTDEISIEQAVEDWMFDLEVQYDLLERE